jgi:dipeptidyl aminopeptidase/acylaminoacyl peptidase
MIHGGPFAQYGWTLFDEAQVYAGAGYAVVYGNPRGSSGYGQAHGAAIRGDVGERSAADLLALLDAAVSRPDLDGSRVGVLGGSHGGFMTSWLIGHCDRFKAAVSERAVNAIDSFVGSSDIGWGFADDLYGADPEDLRRQSPLTYADAITTPLLIIHSEHDWRCPVEQAQRLYVALRQRDAEVEMLLFPGEGHEMSRAGLPSHRVARFDAIVDWFGRYLR